MQFPELPQVGYEGSAYELAAATYRNEIPGFQDTWGCDKPRYQFIGHVVDTVVELEAATRDFIATLTPEQQAVSDPELLYTGLGYFPDGSQFAPHVDAGSCGLSMHMNNSDNGYVEVAHPVNVWSVGHSGGDFCEPNERFTLYRGAGMSAVRDRVVNIHASVLRAQGLTVFSQGNMPGLQPSVHHFRRTEDAPVVPYMRVDIPYPLIVESEEVAIQRSRWFGRLYTYDLRQAQSNAVYRLQHDGSASFDAELDELYRHPGTHWIMAGYREVPSGEDPALFRPSTDAELLARQHEIGLELAAAVAG